MKLLDRYILRKFFSSFFFTVLVFSLVAIIIDFSQNVEEFIDEKLPAGRVIQEFYLPFTVWINGLLWPMFALISVICESSCSRLQSTESASPTARVSLSRSGL